MEDVWWIMQAQLFFISQAFNVQVHAFVLMNNHFHLLISTPNSNLAEAMQWFMRETSREINRLSKRVNQVWGGRYFRSMINSHHYYLHAYKYLYQNPVQAGLCSDVMSYPYQTLQTLLGETWSLVPIVDNTPFDMGVNSCLKWLNKAPKEGHWDQVRCALGKSTFKLGRERSNNKPSDLEFNML